MPLHFASLLSKCYFIIFIACVVSTLFFTCCYTHMKKKKHSIFEEYKNATDLYTYLTNVCNHIHISTIWNTYTTFTLAVRMFHEIMNCYLVQFIAFSVTIPCIWTSTRKRLWELWTMNSNVSWHMFAFLAFEVVSWILKAFIFVMLFLSTVETSNILSRNCYECICRNLTLLSIITVNFVIGIT